MSLITLNIKDQIDNKGEHSTIYSYTNCDCNTHLTEPPTHKRLLTVTPDIMQLCLWTEWESFHAVGWVVDQFSVWKLNMIENMTQVRLTGVFTHVTDGHSILLHWETHQK